jgi:hypothetical protein
MIRIALGRPGYLMANMLGAGALLVLPEMQAKAAAADLATLFQEARTIATQLSTDAATMNSYTRSNLSWQSHTAQITQIKDHINKTASLLSQMEAARGDAKPWHQTAIDRITPVLKELASNTEAVINHLNAKPNHLRDATYQSYLTSNAELATELSRSVGDTVDYDNTKTKLEELQAKLGQ